MLVYPKSHCELQAIHFLVELLHIVGSGSEPNWSQYGAGSSNNVPQCGSGSKLCHHNEGNNFWILLSLYSFDLFYLIYLKKIIKYFFTQSIVNIRIIVNKKCTILPIFLLLDPDPNCYCVSGSQHWMWGLLPDSWILVGTQNLWPGRGSAGPNVHAVTPPWNRWKIPSLTFDKMANFANFPDVLF